MTIRSPLSSTTREPTSAIDSPEMSRRARLKVCAELTQRNANCMRYATSGDIVFAWFLAGQPITLASPDATAALFLRRRVPYNPLSVRHDHHRKNRALRDVVRHLRLTDRGVRAHLPAARQRHAI